MQAATLRDRFEEQGIVFDKVYSSPLARAVETAEIIAGGSVITDERLIEMDYGPYEGMDLHSPAPELILFFSDFVNNPAPEGMEPLDEVTARMGNFLEAIKEEVLHGNVLIATHAIAMKGALEYLTPQSGGSYWSKNIHNCEAYCTEFKDGKYAVPQRAFPREGS